MGNGIGSLGPRPRASDDEEDDDSNIISKTNNDDHDHDPPRPAAKRRKILDEDGGKEEMKNDHGGESVDFCGNKKNSNVVVDSTNTAKEDLEAAIGATTASSAAEGTDDAIDADDNNESICHDVDEAEEEEKEKQAEKMASPDHDDGNKKKDNDDDMDVDGKIRNKEQQDDSKELRIIAPSSPIGSIDERLMHLILIYLCGPDPDDIESYVKTLMNCEKVCKWFHKFISNDLLWGYWSVLENDDDEPTPPSPEVAENGEEDTDTDTNDEEEAMRYLPLVTKYGPGNINYDDRIKTWRELTSIKSVLTRIHCIQNQSISFKDERYILGVVANQMMEYYWEKVNQYCVNGIELREDSAEMLHTLIGEYMHRMFQGANHVIIYNGNGGGNNVKNYPVINREALLTVKRIQEKDTFCKFKSSNEEKKTICKFFDFSDLRPPREPERRVRLLNGKERRILPDTIRMTIEDENRFDLLIRNIACRAGVVKLDNSAFEFKDSKYIEHQTIGPVARFSILIPPPPPLDFGLGQTRYIVMQMHIKILLFGNE